ncbi:unnamed protein product [Coregonus sp. 'balchen']|nr:unnamed protein product [Coregonus sp. 'balchen']
MISGDAGPSMGTGSGAADSASPEEMQPPKPPGQHAVSVLWSFGKCLATLLPVYLAGYFGFSISLVLFGLMVYMGWKHSRNEKVMRLRSAMYVLENERAYTTANAFRSKQELPPWVNFPDVEKVEWMNKAMKVVGVKAHTEHDKRQVILDLYISYAGDVEINVEIKKYFCKAGVNGVQLHGMLRVILEPLIGDVPLVGAITMFFIRRPKLDINWTGLTNLLDIPGLNAMSDTKIMDAIASYLVLPNRLTIPLVADLHIAQLRSPLPRGLVRIHLLEAEELTAKDTVIKGIIDGKSDPYAVLRVGTQTFTSHTVDSNLNPQWREMYEVREREREMFEILQYQAQQQYQNKAVPSAAVLFVYVERAYSLPLKKNGKEPKVGAEILLKAMSYKTKVCERSTSPRWDEAFHFLVRDPKEELLIVKLSHSWGQALGTVVLPLREVLSEQGLILDTQLAVCRSDGTGEGSEDRDHVIHRRDTEPNLRHRSPLSQLGLPACGSAKDGSDPYVSFILLPDKNRTTKRKTNTKKRDLNPEFDFDFSLEESMQRRLDLTVKNNVSFMSRERELIGKLDLDQIDLKSGNTQWYDLVEETN